MERMPRDTGQLTWTGAASKTGTALSRARRRMSPDVRAIPERRARRATETLHVSSRKIGTRHRYARPVTRDQGGGACGTIRVS